MTKRELVAQLARARGIPPRDARAIVDAMLGTIERALSEGHSVTLRGFGRFDVRSRTGRAYRIPGSPASVRVPARLVPVFRCAPGLSQRITGRTLGRR